MLDMPVDNTETLALCRICTRMFRFLHVLFMLFISARLKIIKNANNVNHTSLPGYLADLWWRSMHGTTPFNDFAATNQSINQDFNSS